MQRWPDPNPLFAKKITDVIPTLIVFGATLWLLRMTSSEEPIVFQTILAVIIAGAASGDAVYRRAIARLEKRIHELEKTQNTRSEATR